MATRYQVIFEKISRAISAVSIIIIITVVNCCCQLENFSVSQIFMCCTSIFYNSKILYIAYEFNYLETYLRIQHVDTRRFPERVRICNKKGNNNYYRRQIFRPSELNEIFYFIRRKQSSNNNFRFFVMLIKQFLSFFFLVKFNSTIRFISVQL